MALTDEDVQKIVLAFKASNDHLSDCPYKEISPEDFAAAVKFYKHINTFFEETTNTFWKAAVSTAAKVIIFILLAGISVLVYAGLSNKKLPFIGT